MQDEQRIAMAKALAKAWADDAYKERLLSDPRSALADVGLELPADFELQILEDTPDKKHLVLPVPPAEGEIGEDALAQVSGGFVPFCCWW